MTGANFKTMTNQTDRERIARKIYDDIVAGKPGFFIGDGRAYIHGSPFKLAMLLLRANEAQKDVGLILGLYRAFGPEILNASAQFDLGNEDVAQAILESIRPRVESVLRSQS